MAVLIERKKENQAKNGVRRGGIVAKIGGVGERGMGVRGSKTLAAYAITSRRVSRIGWDKGQRVLSCSYARVPQIAARARSNNRGSDRGIARASRISAISNRRRHGGGAEENGARHQLRFPSRRVSAHVYYASPRTPRAPRTPLLPSASFTPRRAATPAAQATAGWLIDAVIA